MSDIKKNFEFACENIKNLNKTPSNDDLLYLYAHFKQATIGDCDSNEPSFFDVKGKAKWSAWKDLEGLSRDDAMLNYCSKYLELVE